MVVGDANSVPSASAGHGAVKSYAIDDPTRELRQSEILTGLVQNEYDLTSVAGDGVRQRSHEYAVVCSQDCDLLRDYEARTAGTPTTINGVLIYEAEPADQARERSGLSSKEWKRVRQNKDERYHYLPEVPAGLDRLAVGLPALILDFRRFFTMPPDVIYGQVEQRQTAQRRCRLETPFREHLQARLAFYLLRVALPDIEDPP